jgi:hypothetical protein
MENRMRILRSIILMLITTICSASDVPNADEFFAYPKTEITLTVGDVTGHSISSENYQRQTKPTIGEWTFRNGLGHVSEGNEIGEVIWEFLKKSEYGDVYIFSMKSKDGKEKIIPVLFQGEPILIEFGNTRFFIQSVK